MSDRSNTRLLGAYLEESPAPLFFAGMFQTPKENIHNTEKIEIDIQRDTEDIAIVLTDFTAGARENEATAYVNKAFTPPIFDEVGTITAYDAIHRQPGQNPFDNPDYNANALHQAFKIFRRLENKIRRGVELMSSQVLQTGIITGKDANGNTLYTLDYGMRSSHKITTPAWAADGSTGDPITDLASANTVIRQDGKMMPDTAVFGQGAWQRWLRNVNVKAALARIAGQVASNGAAIGLGLGELQPQISRGVEGATFQGYILINNYKINLWTYDGWYRDPQTGTLTNYIADNKVIVRSSKGRLDLSFGAIPIIVPPEQRAMPFLPPVIAGPDKGIVLTTNSYITADGKHVKVEAGTRPLAIPTAIDTYATLTVF